MGGCWVLALELLKGIEESGILPDAICLNSAISAMDGGNQWVKALALLGQMQADGPAPDVFSYNSTISACGGASRWDLAIALLRKMVPSGVSPDAISYNVTLGACEKSGFLWGPPSTSSKRCSCKDCSPRARLTGMLLELAVEARRTLGASF